MSQYEAEITLTEDGATVAFERYGEPVTFATPHEERHMTAKALRLAAAEARRNAEAVGERDLARLYERNAQRLEKALKRIGA